MRKVLNTYKYHSGFSLAEVLASVTVGAIILVAVLNIYGRIRASVAAIERRLDTSKPAYEIIQRIAEDLDKIIAADPDTRIVIENKYIRGLQAARITIIKSIGGGGDVVREFERIIWQASYDYEADANSLSLYRSHSGMTLEDKLLDSKRKDWEKTYPFVPICGGITFFSIQVPQGEQLAGAWSGDSIPPGIVVTISFAEPFDNGQGIFEVPDEEKVTRTIVIDRTRKAKFIFVKEEFAEEEPAGDEEKTQEDLDKPQEVNEIPGAAAKPAGSRTAPDTGKVPDDRPKLKMPR